MLHATINHTMKIPILTIKFHCYNYILYSLLFWYVDMSTFCISAQQNSRLTTGQQAPRTAAHTTYRSTISRSGHHMHCNQIVVTIV